MYIYMCVCMYMNGVNMKKEKSKEKAIKNY